MEIIAETRAHVTRSDLIIAEQRGLIYRQKLLSDTKLDKLSKDCTDMLENNTKKVNKIIQDVYSKTKQQQRQAPTNQSTSQPENPRTDISSATKDKSIDQILTEAKYENSKHPSDRSFGRFLQAFNLLPPVTHLRTVVNLSKENKRLMESSGAMQIPKRVQNSQELDAFNTAIYDKMKEMSLVNKNNMYSNVNIEEGMPYSTAYNNTLFFPRGNVYNRALQFNPHKSLDPMFALSVNTSLLDVSHKTMFLSTDDFRHFSDFYMGTWLLYAWYCIKHKNKSLVAVYDSTYTDVLENLSEAIAQYSEFLSLNTDFESPVTYTPQIDFSKSIDDITTIPNTILGDKMEGAYDSEAANSYYDPYRFLTDTVGDIKYKHFNFNPYITWPICTSYNKKGSGDFFSHPTVNKCTAFQELMNTVFGTQAMVGNYSVDKLLQERDYDLEPMSSEIKKDSYGVFSEIYSFEGMRRMAMFGITFLLTMYRYLSGTEKKNLFKELTLDYLKELKHPRYLSVLTIFPGFSRLLLMYDRTRQNKHFNYREEAETDDDLCMGVADFMDYTTNNTSILQLFTSHINFKNKTTNIGMTEKNKDILRRNIIIQEFEATMNDIHEQSVTDLHVYDKMRNKILYFSKFNKIEHVKAFLTDGFCLYQQRPARNFTANR